MKSVTDENKVQIKITWRPDKELNFCLDDRTSSLFIDGQDIIIRFSNDGSRCQAFDIEPEKIVNLWMKHRLELI